MKRAALLLVCLVLVGCGGDDDSAAQTPPPEASAAAVGPSDPGGLKRDRFHAGRAFALLERQGPSAWPTCSKR